MLSSFRARLALMFGLLAILLVGGLTVRHDQALSRGILADRGESLRSIADGTALLLGEGMSERLREVVLLAESESAHRLGLDPTGWRAELDRLRSGRPYYSWLGVADAQGTVVTAVDGLLTGQSVTERPWFRAGLQSAYLGDVHPAKLLAALLPPSEDNEPLRFIDYAAPLRDASGRVRGVLGVHADWRWARDVIGRMRRPERHAEGVLVYILDHANRVIHRPAGSADADAPGEDQVPTSTPVVMPWRDGQRYLTVGVRLSSRDPAVGRLAWTVVVRQPEAVVLKEVAQVRRDSLALGSTVAAVAVLLAWILAGRLSRPLTSIAAAAGRIEAGDLRARIPLIRQPAELSRLSRALARMTEHLAERQAALTRANQELERRVAERTEALARANALLTSQAMEDALTGLPNRRCADDTLRQMLAQHQREGRPLGLLLGDVDRFKGINDTHGHPAGDRVLQGVAGALRRGLREGDFAARFGGEEFVILLPNTDAAGVAVVGDKLRRAVAALHIAPVGHCTISFGGAVADAGHRSVRALVQRADGALYAAKAGGRNRVEMAEPNRLDEGESTRPSHIGDL